MSAIAASALSARAAAFNGVQAPRTSRQGARRGGMTHAATVTVRAKASSDEERSVIGRREAMSAAGVFAGSLAAASPAFALDFLDDIVGPPKEIEKKKIDLPPLQVTPVSREEGSAKTGGAEKGKAQVQFLKFIAPTIEANIDLPFPEYFRLALHDAGTFKVVGKTGGINGSIRFELDRPENQICKKAFASIEKIKKAVDATTDYPISYADLIAIVPHFAARQQFFKEYVEELGTDTNYEFLFIGTNPFIGAKARLGRTDADGPDPEGLIPGEDAPVEELVAWFKRMGRGPNELAMFAPYLYSDPQKGLDKVAEDGTCARVLDTFAKQRLLGKRAPGPAVTIIKNFKAVTDNALPGGALVNISPQVKNPPYVDYAFVSGGGEIPRVTCFGAFPGAAQQSGSKFAKKARGDIE